MAIQRRLVEAVEVTENRVHVIRLKGIFDASTVSEFEKVVSYLLTRNFYKVVVDLGHVEFISSAGWGAFTAELRRVRENQGDVKLANMSPDLCDVFLLLELDSFIQSFDTVEESLAAFSQPVAAPEPGPARPSILQEIKAASHAREMAEAGARTVAEKTAPDFSESWRESSASRQEMYAAAYAAPASEKAVFAGAPHDSERAYERIEHDADHVASQKEAGGGIGTRGDMDDFGERFEYTAERSASREELKATAPHDGESFGGQSEYAIANGAAETEYGDFSDGDFNTARQTEHAGDGYADETEHASFPVEAHDEGTAGRGEYASDEYADESEYESYSAESEGELGTAGQAEYAGNNYTGNGEYESYSGEFGNEAGVAEQAEYAGDDHADEGEYESYSTESENEFGAAEQAEYAGDDYTDVGEYESYSTESENEYGAAEQAEYTGDNYAEEGEYESYSTESESAFGVAGQAEYAGGDYAEEGEDESYSTEPGPVEQTEYAGDEYADEGEYENSSAEFYSEAGTAGQAEYAGEVYTGEADYEDSAVESYGEDGAVEQAEYTGEVYADETVYQDSFADYDDGYVAADEEEYAGDGYVSEAESENSSSESDDEYGVAEQDEGDGEAHHEYPIAVNDGENGAEHSTPPAASGPEMWELILAGGAAPVDPYIDQKSARTFPDEEAPQEFLASKVTQPLSGASSAEDSLAGSENASSAPAPSSDADNAFNEFVELGAAPDLGFAGHEPFVDDNSQTEPDSEMDDAESGFTPVPAQTSPDGGDDDEFDEFETQDIRDPWILDEIDTLPEEYEMEGGAADGEELSFSASELLSYDLELDAPFSPLPDQVHERSEIEAADESPNHLDASSPAGVDEAFDDSNDLSTPGAEEEDEFARGFAKPVEERAAPPYDDWPEDSSASSANEENLDLPAEEPFVSPARSQRAKTVRAKKHKPAKEHVLTPSAFDDNTELMMHEPALSSQDMNDEARHGGPPPKIPASDNIGEIVRAVVATHPEFGAAMICKFIEDRFEPPVLISRSTVYRFLREADLNTREKREEYAGQLFDPSLLTEEI